MTNKKKMKLKKIVLLLTKNHHHHHQGFIFLLMKKKVKEFKTFGNIKTHNIQLTLQKKIKRIRKVRENS
jgi:hypothetical protein